LPATRSREPFCAPGGIRTSTVSFRSTRPSPWQVGQALCSVPVPEQRGQVRLNFIEPAIWDTLPVPSHCGQGTDPPPGADLVPWQVSQTS
jgi:hypothetical protein